MKLISGMVLSLIIITSSNVNANFENTKEWQNLKKITDELQQKQKDIESGKKSNTSDRNIYKAWECRHMEDGGKRLTVVDTTGIAKMNNVPSTEAAFYGTKRSTASLPPCELELVVPKLRP